MTWYGFSSVLGLGIISLGYILLCMWPWLMRDLIRPWLSKGKVPQVRVRPYSFYTASKDGCVETLIGKISCGDTLYITDQVSITMKEDHTFIVGGSGE